MFTYSFLIYFPFFIYVLADFTKEYNNRNNNNNNINNHSIIIYNYNISSLGIDFESVNVSLKNNTLKFKEYEDNLFREEIFAKFPVHLWTRYGLFSLKDISMINPHWMQFTPPTKQAHYLLAFFYGFIFIIGCFGNFLVCFLFVRCKSLRTAGNILICNLAISDLTLLAVLPVFIYNSIFRGPALGFYACQVYGFMGGVSGTTSIITLTAIACERYQVIAYPLEPLRRRGQRTRAYTSAILSWLYAITISILPLTIPNVVGRYVPEGYLTSCSFEYLNSSTEIKYFIFSFFLAAWLLPFLIIVTCYILIFIAVEKSQKAARSSRQQERFRRELRLAFISLGLVSLWFAAWTPYAVVALLGITGQHHLITPFNSVIPALCCKCAATIDPYIYAISNPRFQIELKKLFISDDGRFSKFIQKVIDTHSRRNKIEDIPEIESDVCSSNLAIWPPNPPVLPKEFKPPKPKPNRSTSFRFRTSINEERF